MKQVEIAGVRLEVPSERPVVLLQESGSRRFLPIWIGSPEATSILLAAEGIVSPRPLTHDLLVAVIETLGDRLERVLITSVDDGVFYATLELESGKQIDGRPSDAIALAVRCDVPVLVADSVLDEAAVELDEESLAALAEPGGPIAAGGSGETDDAADEQQMQEFRAFLAEIKPEDFEGQDPPFSEQP